MKKIIAILPIVFCSVAFGQTKNIVIITLDGYRWQEVFKGADSALLNQKKFNSQDSTARFKKYWADNISERRKLLMPFLWTRVAKEGRLYGNRDLGNKVNVANPYWFSYPGYSEIFSGFVDTAINSNKYPDNPNANVLEFINRQPGFENKVAAFSSWVALERILNEKRSGLMVNAGYEDVAGTNLSEAQKVLNENQHRYSIPLFTKTLRLGSSTYDIAKQYMIQNHPRVLYIGFGDTDHFAHDGQYDFYLDAAHHEDAMIEDLWNFMQSDKFYKDSTTFLVTVDHGRGLGNKWTSHGKKAPHSDEIWFALFGAGIQPSGEIRKEQQQWQKQFASTIAGMVGFNFKSGARVVGQSISGYAKTSGWDSTFRPGSFDLKVGLFKSYPDSKKDIVFLGNSITAGVDWKELLDEQNARNRGISGDITFGVLERLNEVTEGNPSKVFVLIGINDISRNIPDSVIQRNYETIVQRIKYASPRTKIYFQTLMPVNNTFRRFKNHYNKDEHIKAVNEGLKRIAQKEAIIIVDLHPHFLDSNGRLKKELTQDGLHLNAEGYKVWKSVLKPYLTNASTSCR